MPHLPFSHIDTIFLISLRYCRVNECSDPVNFIILGAWLCLAVWFDQRNMLLNGSLLLHIRLVPISVPMHLLSIH